MVRAADELCVTHGAISKQLAQLEIWIGRPLFEANRKRLQPTMAAATLAGAAGRAWRLIGQAVDEITSPAGAQLVQVIAPSTFAMRWLIPRLWSFSTENGDIAVEVTPTHTGQPWRQLPHDVAIRQGEPAPGGFVVTPLLRDELGLLVAPCLLEARASPLPGGLAELPMLASVTRAGELEAWLGAAGVAQPPAARLRRFAHFYIALEAALAGAGAIVAPLVTTQDLIRKGELVEPWPGIRVSGPEYVAFADPRSEQQQSSRRFVEWLVGAAGHNGATRTHAIQGIAT